MQNQEKGTAELSFHLSQYSVTCFQKPECVFIIIDAILYNAKNDSVPINLIGQKTTTRQKSSGVCLFSE